MTFAQILLFNKKLKELLNYLHNIFPEDRKIAYAKGKVVMAIDMTPRLPVLEFMNAIEPYKKRIKSRDEQFFLTLSKEDENLSTFNLGYKYEYLTPEHKETLWTLVETLVKIGDVVAR